jgi:hypothetical protein
VGRDIGMRLSTTRMVSGLGGNTALTDAGNRASLLRPWLAITEAYARIT